MRPESKRNKNDQFQPRWRHFHPQATLFLKNPFDDDITFQVADENNIPYSYRMPGRKVSELPGGAIATLGLKTIVDRMIGDKGEDLLRIWDQNVRKSYEDLVIVRERAAPQHAGKNGPSGPINLTAADEDLNADDERVTAETSVEEPAFPDARRNRQQRQAPAVETRKGVGRLAKDNDVAAMAASSLGSKDQVIEED